MPAEPRWTPGMMNSWQYALRTVNEGLSGAQGLRSLQARGEGIRKQDWQSLMRWANSAYDKAEQAEDMFRAIVLPEEVYQPTPHELRDPYKMTAEVRYLDKATGTYKRHWYSVAGEESKSRELWSSQLQIAMERYGEKIDLSTLTVTKTMFWHRE